MIRHLWKLTWNRKRANALLVLEIFAAFLVVFAVGTMAVYFGGNWRRPLGFDYRDVWYVAIDRKGMSDEEWTPEQTQRFVRLLAEVQTLRPVAAAAGVMVAPFSPGGWTDGTTHDGRYIETEVLRVTPELDRVLGLDLVRGRWFTAADEALPWRPVVINRHLARTLFGSADPVGARLEEADAESGRREARVIGVVSDFRKQGELAGEGNFRFELSRLGQGVDRAPGNLLVKLAPGTPARFEAELAGHLALLAPDWSFEVTPLLSLRETNLRAHLGPLLAAGLIAGFLLLMVGLGLLGVLWQNLLRRTQEIGLRRALGASRGAVERQIVGEQLALASAGVGLGLLLAVQIPAFGLLDRLPRAVWLEGAALAALVIYGLITLAAWYPSRSAGRIEPAAALRAE